MIRHFAKIEWKFQLLLLLSVAGSMLLAGIALSVLIEKNYEKRSSEDFDEFFIRSKIRLEETQSHLNKSAALLASNVKLISSLNLVYKYADIENYRADVFDEEKKKLATRLIEFSLASQLDQVRLYDANGWLVSFSDNSSQSRHKGYIGFEQSKPVLRVSPVDVYKEQWTIDEDHFCMSVVKLDQVPDKLHSQYIRNDIGIGIETLVPVNRRFPDGLSKRIGFISMIKYLDKHFIDEIANGATGSYALMSTSGDVIGDSIKGVQPGSLASSPDLLDFNEGLPGVLPDDASYILESYRVPLAGGGSLFFVASLDRDVIDQEVQQTLQVVLLVFILVAVIIMPIGILFAHYKITLPLEKEEGRRKVVEVALRRSKNMLQNVMDNVPQRIFWKDVDSIYLGCNQKFLGDAGLKNVDDLVGKTDYDMPWTKEESDSYRLIDARVMENNAPEFHIQETQKTAEERQIYLDTNKIPLKDAEGNIIGVLGTYEDVTNRIESQQALEAAKEQAVEANEAKSQFLSRMSHELRTPMNAILGFSQLLLTDEKQGLTSGQQRDVQEIVMAGEHLLALINEVLDLSRIESGSFEVDTQQVNISDILNDCLHLVHAMASENQVEVSAGDSCHSEALVMADPVRIKQVLLNLISNAVKYNVPGGSVRIDFELLDDSFIKVKVSDTGRGISVSDMERLFQPFERLGGDIHAVDGVGIGLVITKDLVELLGGKIGAESVEGGGSMFWFTVPGVS